MLLSSGWRHRQVGRYWDKCWQGEVSALLQPHWRFGWLSDLRGEVSIGTSRNRGRQSVRDDAFKATSKCSNSEWSCAIPHKDTGEFCPGSRNLDGVPWPCYPGDWGGQEERMLPPGDNAKEHHLKLALILYFNRHCLWAKSEQMKGK